MEMKIETFEQTEFVNGKMENTDDPEALKIIEKMGLEGQMNMLTKTDERCPYREMTQLEKKVYEVLYPQHNRIENYDGGMIPLRVLQIAAHAKETGMYKNIYVWSETTKPIDPILVGEVNYQKYHILARWGEALESFDLLLEKAKKMLLSQWKQKGIKKKTECDSFLQNLENEVEIHFVDESNWGRIPF